MVTKAKQKTPTKSKKPITTDGTTVGMLRAAKYNPRIITTQRLNNLRNSIGEFGDLSGVVFNYRTKTLVSGHQRIATLGDVKTRIVQKPAHDKAGTICLGHIEAETANGLVRIPFRGVDWDVIREKAANIAANAHGGHFDGTKLKMVIADIEKSKAFNIELTGLDPLALRSLSMPLSKKDGVVGDESDDSEDGGEFESYGTDLVDKAEHECPKCRYRWS